MGKQISLQPTDFYLIYKTKPLNQHITWNQYDIPNFATIQVFPRVKGGMHEDDNGDAPQIAPVNVKPPPFFTRNPAMWFKSMESQFHLAKIRDPLTKYHYIWAQLPEEIVIKLPCDIPEVYDDLKHAVLAASEKSQMEKLNEAIGSFHLEVGEKPSQLLSRIQSKITQSGLTNTADLIALRFTEALPEQMKMVVAAVPGTASDKAKVADTLTFMCPMSTCNIKYQTQPTTRNVSNKQVEPFKPNQRPKVCRAHLYYGREARTCRQWCQWPDKSNAKVVKFTPQNSPNVSRKSSPTRDKSPSGNERPLNH